MINKLIQDIYPNSNETGMFDVGSMIGVMERILTVVFACLGNFFCYCDNNYDKNLGENKRFKGDRV